MISKLRVYPGIGQTIKDSGIIFSMGGGTNPVVYILWGTPMLDNAAAIENISIPSALNNTVEFDACISALCSLLGLLIFSILL